MSRDSSNYVIRRILAPSPLRLQEHTDLRTQDFAHPPNLRHQPIFINVTCIWSWKLCGIISAIHTYFRYRTRASYTCNNWRRISAVVTNLIPEKLITLHAATYDHIFTWLAFCNWLYGDITIFWCPLVAIWWRRKYRRAPCMVKFMVWWYSNHMRYYAYFIYWSSLVMCRNSFHISYWADNLHYTYIHTYICTYVHTYIHTYVHTYVRTYILTYILTYVHTYIRT